MAPRTDLVCVGALAGAFGVQGEARLKSFCADPAAIADYAPLVTEDGRGFGVKLTRSLNGAFAARLTGVTTREQAEALKGTRLYAPRDRLPNLPEDEFYHADLIGLVVLDTGGAELGRVKAVLDHGAGDILEIARPGQPDLLLPFTRAGVPTVDLATGRIIADPRSTMMPEPGPEPVPEPEAGAPWTARVLTLFPEMFPGPLGASLTGRALGAGLWRLDPRDIRAQATDRHRTVDDSPAGGGAGMVLRADIAAGALDAADSGYPRADWPVIYLSPRGRPFDQALARRFARGRGLTLLCGRFEVDERALAARAVEEVSLGDFVLTGEIAAMALIDASVRLIPRVLGNAESSVEESFSNGLLEYPQYTRPTEWEGLRIPEVLLSGHHGRIAEWRRSQSERLTKERRPDLWRAHVADAARSHPAGDAELSDTQIIAVQGEQTKDDRE